MKLTKLLFAGFLLTHTAAAHATPLLDAVHLNSVNLVSRLIENGANVNARGNTSVSSKMSLCGYKSNAFTSSRG